LTFELPLGAARHGSYGGPFLIGRTRFFIQFSIENDSARRGAQ
jgi:hypothetical protein